MEAPLQKRVLKYYDYVWLRTRGVDPESLFNVLPLSLWGDVTLDLYKSTLEGVSGFAIYDSVTPVELNRLILLINPSTPNMLDMHTYKYEYIMI